MHIGDITTDKFNTLMSGSDKIILIVKFSAKWCKPCKLVSPIFEQYTTKHYKRENVVIGDVDIDESDFYKELKRKRMINGIPCIMAFYNKDCNDNYLIPDDSVTGANIQDVTTFLNRCDEYISKHTT